MQLKFQAVFFSKASTHFLVKGSFFDLAAFYPSIPSHIATSRWLGKGRVDSVATVSISAGWRLQRLSLLSRNTSQSPLGSEQTTENLIWPMSPCRFQRYVQGPSSTVWTAWGCLEEIIEFGMQSYLLSHTHTHIYRPFASEYLRRNVCVCVYPYIDTSVNNCIHIYIYMYLYICNM